MTEDINKYESLHIETNSMDLVINIKENKKEKYQFGLWFEGSSSSGCGCCSDNEFQTKQYLMEEIFELITNFDGAVQERADAKNNKELDKLKELNKTLRVMIKQNNAELDELREYKKSVEVIINKK